MGMGVAVVAYNFQKQFADDVEYGIKLQTIRQKARCQTGSALQLYTGMRTKNCRKLADAVCLSVTPVIINSCSIILNGAQLPIGNALRDELGDCDNDFARKDGFDGFVEMAKWFENRYGLLPFEGVVIKWRLK
jgi:hypothetical protein